MNGTIDGSSQFLGIFNYVRVDITVTNVYDFVAGIVNSNIGPGLNETVLLLYRGGEFDPSDYFANLLNPILVNNPVSRVKPEGEYTLAVVANRAGDTGTFELGIAGGFFGWGPSTDELLSNLSSALGSLARLSAVKSGGNIRRGVSSSFATRNASTSLDFSDAPVISTSNGKLVGNAHAWVEVSGFRAQESGIQSYSGRGVQVGADFGLSENWILGLALGYDDLNASTALTSTEGDYTFAQPYVAYERGDWTSQFTLALGQSEYTQTSAGGTGTADSDVWSLEFAVARELPMESGLTLSPMFSMLYGEEKITGKTGTLAGAGTSTVDFNQTSLGARLHRQFSTGRGYLGLHADYVGSSAPAAIAGGGFMPEGLSGRFEAGMDIGFAGNGVLDIGVEAGGLGSEMSNYTGRLRLSFSF